LPGSSDKIKEDNEYTLFTIITFKKFVEDFKNAARDNRFTVRKHEPHSSLDQDKKDKLLKQLDKRKKGLNRFCRTYYGEVYMSWIHLKAIRVFVESVLRFGLPANFQAVLVEPPKNDKKLRKSLFDMYKHLTLDSMGEEVKDNDKSTAGLLGNEEFYPYVYVDVFIDTDTKL